MRWISMILIIIIVFDLWSHQPNDGIIFIQVGQGDATLFNYKNTHLLVDVGPQTINFNGGQRFVWPELRKQGIRKLDAIIITHLDIDHYGGLSSLLQRVRVDRVIFVMDGKVPEEQLNHLETIIDGRAKLEIINGSQSITLKEIDIDVIPGLNTISLDDNLSSPFISVSFQDSRTVLTGDAPTKLEHFWLRFFPPQADILKAGHHGSSSSTSIEWLKAIKPKYVIFSSGRNNPWGHPSKDTLRRAKDHGSKVLRTDADGSIHFELNQNGKLQLRSSEKNLSIFKFFQR